MSKLRLIIYDKTTGNRRYDCSFDNSFTEPTLEQLHSSVIDLQQIDINSLGLLRYENGEFEPDFDECGANFVIDLTTLKPLFSYPDPSEPTAPPVYQKPLSEQVSALSEQLKSADEKYRELNVTSADLTTLKSAKMSQLEEACSSAITSGFDFTVNSVSYKFSCSLEAQANFQGADTLFKDGSITEAEWTVVNNSNGKIERVALDVATFNSIKLQVFSHINSKISLLRNTLQPLVESATTNADVDAVVW
jgi:hypothetical protein